MSKPALRAAAYGSAIVVGALLLASLSVVAALAAHEARGTSHDVRASTELWNAYQQARYSVVQEALLTQEFRLAASPYFEERFHEEATRLERALRVVERATPTDAELAQEALAANAQLRRGIAALVEAVNAGDAGRAERIARQDLDPLFSSAIGTVERGAAAHAAESRVGLEAAETAEETLRRSAAAVVFLALLVAAVAVMAIRFRRGLDAARRLELERLRDAAFTDSLTGVHNHRAFHEQLAALLDATAPDETVTLLMLDLDGLKVVNDRFGHQAGDDRIKLLSRAAASTVRQGGSLYRLGGDEFALVLPDCAGPGAVAVTEGIDECFRRAAPSGDVSFSGGIAVWHAGLSKDELVRRADLALIEAKRLRQLALVYTSAFEIAVLDEPADQRQAQVLANALARAVDTKDAYTHSHSETVAELCALMAVELGFDAERAFKVRLAGLLHDVGKIGVPDSILQKPGRLTEAEFEVMKAHPVLGAHILAAAELHEEAEWVLAHHERPDGKGYPNGGVATPLEARIISVADAFEAMVSERPYREPRPASEALGELARCAGTQFDPRCVRALSVVLGAAPVEADEATLEPARPRPLPLGAAA